MILTKNYEDINRIYDFNEGIICDVRWDENVVDLLVTVYYYFDGPKGLSNKDVVICFKNCTSFVYDAKNMIESIKKLTIIKPHPTIDSIEIQKGSSLNVKLFTNYASPMFSIICDEIWIELKEKE